MIIICGCDRLLMTVDAVQIFIVGSVGMIGSDDILACFIAGNVLAWE